MIQITNKKIVSTIMQSSYSILHISDLHKESSKSYDNLFCSLVTDREKRINAGITPEQIIVVSGDLIEGVKDYSDDAEDLLMKQYDEVTLFLNSLVETFLQGDKRRMVIVPGNHDMSRPASMKSMEKSMHDKKEDYKIYRLNNNNVIRWNWSDFAFYLIKDKEQYKQRFSAFQKFYNNFYGGIRSLPDNIEEEAWIIDLEDYNITFACFNSCCHLDHLNPIGCINPSALAGVCAKLNKYYSLGRLIVGVWHHHISGYPCENNYMDSRILNAMMDGAHMQLGMYGHQHIADVVNEYKDVTSNKNIILVSSGTLYGGTKSQRLGQSRQYNILEIQMQQGMANLNVHIREDKSTDSYDIPDWNIKHIGSGGNAAITFQIALCVPEQTFFADNIDSDAHRSQDFYQAYKRMSMASISENLKNKYCDNYLSKLTTNQILELVSNNPLTETQYLYALDAACETKNEQLITDLLSSKFEKFQSPILNDRKQDAFNLLQLWQKK